MKILYEFTKFQSKIFFRDFKATIIGFLMPVLSFVIFSNLFSNTDIGAENINIVAYLVPAFIIIIIANSVLLLFGQH